MWGACRKVKLRSSFVKNNMQVEQVVQIESLRDFLEIAEKNGLMRRVIIIFPNFNMTFTKFVRININDSRYFMKISKTYRISTMFC